MTPIYTIGFTRKTLEQFIRLLQPPNHCHRRLVAEWWAEQLPNVGVVHSI